MAWIDVVKRAAARCDDTRYRTCDGMACPGCGGWDDPDDATTGTTNDDDDDDDAAFEASVNEYEMSCRTAGLRMAQ